VRLSKGFVGDRRGFSIGSGLAWRKNGESDYLPVENFREENEEKSLCCMKGWIWGTVKGTCGTEKPPAKGWIGISDILEAASGSWGKV
jgi:hypothetical protein